MPEIEPLPPLGPPPPAPAASAGETAGSAGRVSGRPTLLRNIVTAIAFGAVIAALVWFLDQSGGTPASQSLTQAGKASGPALRVGQEAPDFRVVGLDGAPVRLSEFRGRPVWLTFWATWCPPCRVESPDIQAAYQEHRDSGLVILALDLGENPGTVRSYAKRTGLTFTIALDQTKEIAALYRIAGPPTHYFIDADGVIRDFQIGSMGKKTMEKKIAAILSPPPGVETRGR